MKAVLLICAVIFVSFVVWMNITPGHFQVACACRAEYITGDAVKQRQINLCPFVGVCAPDAFFEKVYNNILIYAALLDLNK